jgi:hypothetical protein
MKLTHTLRTCLLFAILVFTVGLISQALAQVSPAPKKVSPAPKKVSPAPKKVSPAPAKVSPGPAKVSPAPKKVSPAQAKDSPPMCNRTIKVQVVALDQPWMWNRLGASQPGGMIYALARDVVSKDGPLPDDLKSLKPADLTALCGKVRLRDDKRARPLVLRANKGDCLEITFVNLLSAEPALVQKNSPPPTRWAGLNATGMELVSDTVGDIAGINSDSSWVGQNANSLAKNGEIKTYRWSAVEEGTFLIYSGADMDSQYQANQGLFGAIHVEPEGAEWYRSQITHYDLVQATLTTTDLKEYSRKLAPPEAAADPPVKVVEKSATAAEKPTPAGAKPPPGAEKFTKQSLESQVADKRSSVTVYVDESLKTEQRIHSATGQPLIYYNAVYTDDGKPRLRGKRRIPVLQMLQVNEVGDPFYNEPLQKQNAAAYIKEVSDLDAGIIPGALRAVFKEKKHELSAGARVVEQYRYSWLITDQGNAYYLEATPPSAAEAGRLKIFKAELELIYSDLTAVITGPNAGRFALSNTSPTFRQIPASPDRRQPYREYTIIYHQAFFAAQAFSAFSNANLMNVIQAGADNFAINYGSGAIGPEVIANRLGVGPMGNKDSVDLKFEEFFLSAWAVGDPAMVVDCPANATNAIVDTPDKHRELHKEVPLGSVTQQLHGPATPFPTRTLPPAVDDFAPLPAPPMPATKAFFPDDPSNVYHSYMNDHVKFRILHAGGGPSHVHHLHAHQWLRSPDSDSSSYLDSQLIVPGSAFTLEITYNGSGNRNKTVGDSIFHCHFYPHFAQGMWALWRVHDVFEEGTFLDEKGVAKSGINRALPDGEIRAGTPIPAIVPLPTLGMAPMPAKVQLTDLSPLKAGEGQGRRVEVIPEGTGPDGKKIYKNPGFPFFIPGIAGHRPPHPPLDLAWLEDPATNLPILDDKKEKIYLDGGLPRHIVLDGKVVKEFHTRWDFSKDTALRGKDGKIIPGAGSLTAMAVPEEGTPVEIAAMNEHAIRTRPTTEPGGQPGNFILNGLPPTNGAPYADPGVNDQGNSNINRRRYQAAVFQVDTILNKKGWHYPQQRMISLWQDVAPTIDKTRPPEPFFFRTNTSDSIQFWHTNLLPAYYELDDFQVRTPTDVVGQHIHLVKFDVTASDGAGNGFNYEDGTFAPEEVQERIDSINARGGLFALDPATGFVNMAKQEKLTLKKVADYYPPPGSTFVNLVNGVPQWNKPAGKPGSVFGPPPGGHAEAWDGAQTTIQLWDVDSLLNNEGEDRTLRTVFSHDHFGPSTHQQAGLYAGMVVEPEKSEWYLPYGERMNTRSDGGPTSWQGYIVTEDPEESYREFMLEFQDMQLAYAKGSPTEPSATLFDPNLPSPPNPPNTPKLTPSPPAAPIPPPASAAFWLGQEHGDTFLKTSGAWTVNSVTYPSVLEAYSATYAAGLDQGKLPGPFTLNGVIATPGVTTTTVTMPGITGVFPQFGIPLSDKAAVTVDNPTRQWTITEAPNQINAGTKYVVQASRDQPNGPIKKLVVFTPDITPGWASGPDGSSNSKFALNAPRNIPGVHEDDPQNALNGPPFAQIVSQNQFGTYSLNYRNEPVPFRVGLPGTSPTPSPDQSDLALAFTSITRADPDLNLQPDGKTAGYPTTPLVPNAQAMDPYTPLLQAYVNDKVQIRTLVGAHTQAHALQIHGVKWRFEPDNANSGWRNAQLMGLSEHYEMVFDVPGTAVPHKDLKDLPQDLPPFADYFYSPSAGIVGLNNGLWGIMRAYGDKLPYSAKLKDGRPDPRWLEPLPNNPKPQGTGAEDQFKKGYDANPSLQLDYDITAVTASVLPGGKLVYNKRAPALATDAAVLYVRTADLEAKNGQTVLKAGVPIEPLILRAAAGQWIKVTLRNGLALNYPGLTDPAFKTPQELPYGTPFGLPNLSAAQMLTSTKVGLHPQLVGYDPVNANGFLVGFNPQDKLVTAGPTPAASPSPSPACSRPTCQEYYWYAGEVKPNGAGFEAIPIEFGATNLTPADPLLQSQFGMVGALIIEPEGSTWDEDATSRASADVKVPGGNNFREFVVIDQNMVANSASPKNPLGGIGAINYRSEPFSKRLPPPTEPNPNPPPAQIPSPQGYSAIYSNQSVNPPGDPETPIFLAAAGTPVRFRLLIPGTETSNALNRPPVFMVHSHPWQEEPYINDSTKIGFNPLSETQGAQQAGVGQKFDLLFPSAGGQFKIPGDYLYTTYQTANAAGTWGLFRVTAAKVAIEKAVLEDGFAQASGVVKTATEGAPLPKQLRACLVNDAGETIELGTTSVAADGRWTFKVASNFLAPARLQVTAIEENGKDGATATAPISDPPSAKFVTQSDKNSPALSP